MCLVALAGFSCKGSQPVVERPPTQTETAVRNSPTDAGSRQRIDYDYVDACTQMMRGDYQGAIASFEQVVSADPDNDAAMYNIARLSLELRDYDKAIAYGKSAIEKQPDNYWYYNILARAYELKGNYTNAISTLEKLVGKYPERYKDRLELVELYVKNNQNEKAVNQLDEIDGLKGLTHETGIRKYQLLIANQAYEDALKVAQNLIRMNEQESQYYQLQYDALLKLGKQAEAVKTLEDLLEADDQNEFALLTLADYYKNTNQLDKSDKYLFRAFNNPEISAEGKIRLIENLIPFVEKEPEIIPRLNRLVAIFNKTHPGTARSLAIQGKMMFLEQKADSARIYFRNSLEMDPNQTNVWLDLIETSFVSKDYKQLNRDTEEALEFYPNQARFLFFYGLSSARLKDYDAAIYALEKIKKIGTQENDLLGLTYAELGIVYQEQNKAELANKHFEEALLLTPNDPYVLEKYGDALSMQGNKQGAETKWKAALKAGAQGWQLRDKLKEQ